MSKSIAGHVARAALASCFVLVGLSISIEASEPPANTVKNDAQQALAFYKGAKYDDACPLFLKVANANPEKGTAWADLGLCEAKRGHKADSIHASLLAVRYGDEKTRKNAYFNLDAAGYSVELPKAGDCARIASRPEFDSDQPLWACMDSWEEQGNRGGSSGTRVLFVVNEKAAEEIRKIQQIATEEDSVHDIDWGEHTVASNVLDIVQYAYGSASSEGGEDYIICVVLAVDPRNGRVGTKCGEGSDGKAKPKIAEVTLHFTR